MPPCQLCGNCVHETGDAIFASNSFMKEKNWLTFLQWIKWKIKLNRLWKSYMEFNTHTFWCSYARIQTKPLWLYEFKVQIEVFVWSETRTLKKSTPQKFGGIKKCVTRKIIGGFDQPSRRENQKMNFDAKSEYNRTVKPIFVDQWNIKEVCWWAVIKCEAHCIRVQLRTANKALKSRIDIIH